MSLEPKYSTNEPVLRGHLSKAITFCPSLRWPLKTGLTVYLLILGSYETGSRGPKGNEGPEGRRGKVGETGLPGDKGNKGMDGIPGVPGFKGVKGDLGERGPPGYGINCICKELQALSVSNI